MNYYCNGDMIMMIVATIVAILVAIATVLKLKAVSELRAFRERINDENARQAYEAAVRALRRVKFAKGESRFQVQIIHFSIEERLEKHLCIKLIRRNENEARREARHEARLEEAKADFIAWFCRLQSVLAALLNDSTSEDEVVLETRRCFVRVLAELKERPTRSKFISRRAYRRAKEATCCKFVRVLAELNERPSRSKFISLRAYHRAKEATRCKFVRVLAALNEKRRAPVRNKCSAAQAIPSRRSPRLAVLSAVAEPIAAVVVEARRCLPHVRSRAPVCYKGMC